MAESVKVLVYWLRDKQWSVVSEQAVRGGDFLPGDYVQTKFQGKFYPSIVIAKDQPKVVDQAEQVFGKFLKSCLQEEAAEDVEKCILAYVKAAQSPDVKKEATTPAPSTGTSQSTKATIGIAAQSPDVKKEATTPGPSTGTSQSTKATTGIAAQSPDVKKEATTPAPSTGTSQSTKATTGIDENATDYLKKRQESSSERRIRKLEEEVKSLRRKIRRIEETVNGHVEKTPSQPVDSQESDQNETPLRPVDTLESQQVLVQTEKNDIEDVKKCRNEQEKFKFLCKHFFTIEELKNCSRTGKRSVKCSELGPRPAIDPSRFCKLQDAVKKYLNYDNTTLVKKFENLQKVLRKQ